MAKTMIRVLACWLVVSALQPEVLAATGTQSLSPDTLILDTQMPFADEAGPADRTRWTVVRGLQPGNAPYAFAGDAVVDNEYITAVFCSAKGSVSIYSKADPARKKVELVPLGLKGKPARITDCTILRNTGRKAVLQVTFSGGTGEGQSSAVFSFAGNEIVTIEPAANMKGISLLSAIEYGVSPGFIADDLIYDADDYPSVSAINIPCESLFLGLLTGCSDMLVVTWPDGGQRMRLVPAGSAENRLIESVDFDNDGRSIFLALLHAPGIWHREELKPSYLEKDVTIDWERPFAAKWKTQLLEAGVKTTFRFRESKEEIWRAVIGYYTYPVWFEGRTAHYHLSKKIPPRGVSLIYSIERNEASGSPASVADILRQTLDKETSERKIALQSRASMNLVRPDCGIDSGDLAQHAARSTCPVSTCAVTKRLGDIFDAGQEQQRREDIESGIEDMMYFVVQHRNRINKYMAFASETMKFLARQGKDRPVLTPYIGRMQTIAQEIPQEYDRLRDAIKDLDYAAGLARQSTALAREKRPNNSELFAELGRKWRTMGGAQDDLVREFHTTVRKLFQEAGYGCATLPDAVEISKELRRRCAECLSNPSTYEIWRDY